MRTTWIAAGAGALALGLAGLIYAADETHGKYDVKGTPGACEGVVIQLFKDEKIIEFKVDKLLAREADKAPATPRDDERRADEKASEAVKGDALREGQVIFLHVADARIFDEKGTELKSAWFSRDAGWSALKEGGRLKVDYMGTHLIPAPKDFPREARGDLLVYHVEDLHVLVR
jgi:hypothetical protein